MPDADTIWIADWTFDAVGACDDTGWQRIDNRILNDGSNYWHVGTDFSGTGNITGTAAILSKHDLCWGIPDGYGNEWDYSIVLQYTGSGATLSFDYLLDSRTGTDFLYIEADSACSANARVDYTVNPAGTPETFRMQLLSDSGLNLAGNVSSLALPDFGAPADTHCVYIRFDSDDSFSQEDGLQPTTLGAGLVVDNLSLTGGLAYTEDFEGPSLDPRVSLVNSAPSTPFGEWAQLFQHPTDNDICTENTSCAWIFSDPTLPANDPSVAFGPNGAVVRNWLDDAIVSPWVALPGTGLTTFMTYRSFGGNDFNESRIVLNRGARVLKRVDNTDSPTAGDSLDCVSPWLLNSWTTLGVNSWATTLRNISAVDSSARQIQLRFRVSDWQYIAGATPPVPHIPGPGPYIDRVRIGRTTIPGPAIDEGIDSRTQAQDAFPTEIDPNVTPAGEHFRPTTDRFGTCAFSMAQDLGAFDQLSLITGDSIVVEVEELLGAGGVASVDLYGAIISGPHAGKAPPPWTVGSNGFFAVPADTVRTSTGQPKVGFWFVDLDDDYFRGGDVLHYFWLATDVAGGVNSDPMGLTSIPASIQEAEAQTGGLLEVSFLPTINWDSTYVSRIQMDPNGGKVDPTPQELTSSSQARCVLYVQQVNPRRRSGDINRTSFMYTLDRLGYRESYDVYDLQSISNTNNQLGGRATTPQATGYAIIVYDVGADRFLTLPDGIEPEAQKIDQAQWFRDWLAAAATSEAGRATLWMISNNVMEEKGTNPLLATDMGVVLVSGSQSIGINPDLTGQGSFTWEDGSVSTFTGAAGSVGGGICPDPGYDALDASGTAVVTHRFTSGASVGDGAIVMNANPAGSWNTILSAFAWADFLDANGAATPSAPPLQLAGEILAHALPAACQESLDPTDVPGGGGGTDADLPRVTALHANVPNPFNPRTTLRFDLARAQHVQLRIYDIAGRRVRTLVDGPLPRERHAIVWDGRDDQGRRLPSGVYLTRLVAEDLTQTRKMLLVE